MGLRRIFFYRQEMRVSIFAKRRFPMHAKNVNSLFHICMLAVRAHVTLNLSEKIPAVAQCLLQYEDVIELQYRNEF